MCKPHREVYGNRTVELKRQTKGCWDEWILLEHRGKKFLECRTHLQVRLDKFEPPVHGALGKHRDSRVRGRDSSVDTKDSQSSSRIPVSKDVSFKADDSSDCSDVSSVSMPELQEMH